jgi:protein-L-isoaspartate(D-aspartate) O-methyltransferase
MKPARRPALPEGVDDHGASQRSFWAAQRVAWGIFALILIACLLGLLGRGGMFSTKMVESSGGDYRDPRDLTLERS